MILWILWHKMMLARDLVGDKGSPVRWRSSLPDRSYSLHISQHNCNFKKKDKNLGWHQKREAGGLEPAELGRELAE